MDNLNKKNYIRTENPNNPRRDFIKKSLVIGALTGTSGLTLLNGCKGEIEEVTPSEDLMREHGVLNRIMLIYDTCGKLLANSEGFPLEALNNSAIIIRDFIEDYHEKLEEDFHDN